MKTTAALAVLLLAGAPSPAATVTGTLTVALQAAAVAGPANTITLSNASGAAIAGYPLQFGRPFLAGAIPAGQCPVVLVDGAAAPSQADIKNRYPDGSAEFAVIAVAPGALAMPIGAALVLSFAPGPCNNVPLTTAQMLDPGYDFDAVITAAPGGSASARAMLTAGKCTPWTQGPVAQTIMCADDSTAAAYDLAPDGVHKALRPRFIATFWPATHQVAVRAIGEADLANNVEDLTYRLSLSAGQTPQSVYTADLTGTQATNPKEQWAMSNWSRTFWLGSTPPAQVDIDNNLAYLVSTRWLPNYDASIKPTSAAVANAYALWTGKPHDLYDGAWDGGQWQNAMGAEGERPEIGPYPTWDVLWLYTGDWRMRQMALGMDDLAAAWPGNMRETDPSRRLQRSDPTGLSPETGLGHTVSITDRRSTEFFNVGYIFTQGLAADRPIEVGAINIHQPWAFEGAHQPQPWFVPYVLTGDPWYLNEAYLWAGFSASRYPGGTTTAAYGRGPTGAEGVIDDELRGSGWVLRSRAETALMAPDSDPEKAYFTTLTNDAIARWEGSFGISGTPFDGSAVKLWGAKYGNYYSDNNGPDSAKPPTLGNWESNGNPTSSPPVADVTQNEAEDVFVTGAVGSWTSPWMQFFNAYGLGRAKELGFATDPLFAATTARWFTGLINTSGFPEMIVTYRFPVEARSGGFFATWAALTGALTPAYLTGNGWTTAQGETGPLSARFGLNVSSEGYAAWAVPAASFVASEPGGAQAWTWMQANVFSQIPDFASLTPKWAIVPRTDANALPAMPTH